MSSSTVPLVNLNSTLGALQIGVYISLVLFGVVSLQTYYYYAKFPEDRATLKIFVS